MRPRRMRLGYGIETMDYENCTTRFNEAEAHAPRIQLLKQRIHSKVEEASMRPRRMRLGYAQHTTCCFPRQYRCVFEQWLFILI